MSRNAELFDAMLKVAVGVLILAAWTYVVLEQRDLRRAIRRQRTQLHQDRRAIVQLQGAAVRPPTSIGQPMASVTGQHRAIVVTQGGLRSLLPNESRGPSACATDPDPTLRLARPPALSDIEHVLTQAGRALTATEIAAKLDRQPWDLLPDIDRAMAAGRIRTVPGHTAGRTAYALTDGDTLRMARMPVLPGTVAR